MSHPPNEACSVDDCGKAAKRAGLCEGHRKRKRLGQSLSTPLRGYGDPRRTLMEAAFAFADASELDEDSYFFAWKRLYAAATRVGARPRTK